MTATFTLCFCGTSCWPDEGITDRSNDDGSSPLIYEPRSGYIPVSIYRDIASGKFQGKAIVPGAGEPWAYYQETLWVPCTTNNWIPSKFNKLDKLSDVALGNSMWDLAGHGAASVAGIPSAGRGPARAHIDEVEALIQTLRLQSGVNLNPKDNAAPPSHECYRFSAPMIKLLHDTVQKHREGGAGKVTTINLIGHSRGAVAAIIASHELAYLFPDAEVNIFAIDPVPGPGVLAPEITTLARNVARYVGVYAIDETSSFFNGVVPRPFLNDGYIDPLAEDRLEQERPRVRSYNLVYAPGRHATVAGNGTTDGKANPSKRNAVVGTVGFLINCLARACLNAWGTAIAPISLNNALDGAKQLIKDHSKTFREMREFTYVGDYHDPGGKRRGITSSSSDYHGDWSFLEDVIGIDLGGEHAPAKRARGVISWHALEQLPNATLQDGAWPLILRLRKGVVDK